MAADAEELKQAVRDVLAAQPELGEAGPKAVLSALKDDPRAEGLSAPKCKRVLQAVKAEESERKAEEEKREKEALARRGTALDCPGGHGLARFIANHSSYCCDVCRCYVSQGSGLWGCRQCDWDVCEQKCRPKGAQTWPELRSTFASLETRAVECSGERTKLAQIESEVHMLEKALDSADLVVLAKAERQTDEAARAERKSLLASCEALLSKIEAAFSAASAPAA